MNLLGCLLFGLVWVMADERQLLGAEMRLVILVGFMGAFTTFSSLIFETGELVCGAQWAYAARGAEHPWLRGLRHRGDYRTGSLWSGRQNGGRQ